MANYIESMKGAPLSDAQKLHFSELKKQIEDQGKKEAELFYKMQNPGK
jgi:hypothetical protein